MTPSREDGCAEPVSYTHLPVIHLTGDGSFHMNLNEACTAVSYELPIITVIFNNTVLGMVRQWQTAFYEKRYSSTDPHLSLIHIFPAVQFAQRMEEAGLCTAEEFLDVANNGDFSQFTFWNKRDENPNQFMACEGYLFLDTYDFFVGDDVYRCV